MMQINLSGTRVDAHPLRSLATGPRPVAAAEAPEDFEDLVLVTGCDMLASHVERVFGGEGRTAAEIRALLARYVGERIAARQAA